MKALVSLILIAAFPFQAAWADLGLAEPEVLLARASKNKNSLRDVINEIDQNVTEMRDQRTFDKYFYTLDQLDLLATKLNLNSIYPEAVKRLGNRMVQKGVNWLNVVSNSTAEILYYHRWMSDAQSAFTFLYSAKMQFQSAKSMSELRAAAGNLEAALIFADSQWPNEQSLRLLYRSVLSELAAKILKTPGLDAKERAFWLAQVYSPDIMAEMLTQIQDEIYNLNSQDKAQIHALASRLNSISSRVASSAFGSNESLTSQIGDTSVSLILKALRFEESLPADEWTSLYSTLRKRHYLSLADAWTTADQIPSGKFGEDYIQQALKLVSRLEAMGLVDAAEALNASLSEKTAPLMARRLGLEGSWKIKDSRGRTWTLNVVYANEKLLFAQFNDASSVISYRFFRVSYDLESGSFFAQSSSGISSEATAALALKMTVKKDNTLEIGNSLNSAFDRKMIAKKAQTFPDLLSSASNKTGGTYAGSYKGKIILPTGASASAELVIVAVDGRYAGQLTMSGVQLNLNIGSDTATGALYLTSGQMRGTTSWVHLRAQRDDKGALTGRIVIGNKGMSSTAFTLKQMKK